MYKYDNIYKMPGKSKYSNVIFPFLSLKKEQVQKQVILDSEDKIQISLKRKKFHQIFKKYINT